MDFEKIYYESLPLAYIGAGAMTLMLMDSRLKMLPALLLIASGLLVMAWRKSARSKAQSVKKRLRR
jgi:hypothetical protein